MPLVVVVALGGSLGALARYGADKLIEGRVSAVFPWSTLAINVSGCFVAGLVIAALVDRHEAPAWVRAGLVVGFLGAYTTFSTFAQETLDLAQARDVAPMVANALASVTLGVLAVYAGALIGRTL